jgi:ankyrin repeat protein
MSSLFQAIASGNPATVKDCETLMQELNQVNNDGETPLIAAVKSKNGGIIDVLLKAGCNVNQCAEEAGNTKGYTALHFASRAGDIDMINQLLKAKADIHRRSADGWTPLHCSVFSGHVRASELLVEKGADVNAANEHGMTPLVICASKGLNGLLRILLAKGGKTDAIDVNGDTLMHHVFHYQMQKLFEGDYEVPEVQYDIGVTLAIAGADIDAKNRDGKTGLEYVDDEMPSYHDTLRILSHNAERFRNSKTQFNYMTLVSVSVETYIAIGLDIKHAVDLTEKARAMESERQAEKKRRAAERPAGGCPVMKGGRGRRKAGKDATPDIPTDGSDPSGGKCPFFQKKDGAAATESSAVVNAEEPSGHAVGAPKATKVMDTPHGKVEVPADGSDPSGGKCPFFKPKAAEGASAPVQSAPVQQTKKAFDAKEAADMVMQHHRDHLVAANNKPPGSLWEAVYENRVTILLVIIGFFMGIWFEQMTASFRGGVTAGSYRR